jgi:hypothetical protein
VKYSTVVLLIIVFLSVGLCARENTDVVVMKNGDRLTGQVKGLNAGVLYVSLPYVIQTLSVDWNRVARLESAQLFLVRTADGRVYRGTLQTPAGEQATIQRIDVIEAMEQRVSVERDKIVEVAETSNKFWQRFNGELRLGTTFSKANDNLQYSLGSAAEYLRERWSTSASWNSNLSSSTGTTAATRNEITGGYSRLLRWNNYFYSALGEFLQSSEQGIKLQSSLGGGIGHYFRNTNRAKIAVLGGFAWQNTRYDQAVYTAPTQNMIAGMVAGNMKLFKFNKTNLELSGLVFPMLNDPGRVKLNTNAAYYIKITGDLSWNVSFYGSWDNRPPPHFSGSDYGTSSGLSWTFGIK